MTGNVRRIHLLAALALRFPGLLHTGDVPPASRLTRSVFRPPRLS